MSTMFVRVSTPEGQTNITVEQFAAAMAEYRMFIFDDSGSEYERIADILHKLTVAGFISEVYKNDFYSVAQTMSKYVRVNIARETERQLGMDSKYVETERKPLKPRRTKVYHGEEPRYAS